MNNERATSPGVDFSLLVLRLIVGAIFFAHGAQKLFGLFGGGGMELTLDAMEKLGVRPLAYPVAIGECIGGAGIIVGFLARFSAASNIVIMIGAIGMVHGEHGFFQSNGGYEYNLALIGLLMPILVLGPGRLSLGRCLPLPKSANGRPIVILE
jgi:putative oxidoreductase